MAALLHAGTHVVPAHVDEDLAARMQMLALSTHRLLGLRDYSRTDFVVSRDNRPYILEINSLPGMTATSLLPKAAAAAGITFPQLCRRIVELSWCERGREGLR